jgi:hypothetical protein
VPADACVALGTGCFAAGTKLLTRRGWVGVEHLAVGDELAARDQFADPVSGAVDWKPVEAVFRRLGRVLHLHFPDGELIRTTPEHPFCVEGKGWTAAGALTAGDRIATLSGEWVAVTEVFDTQEWEPVFNMRVADHHTYFVGDEHWGWAAWAHNSYYDTWIDTAFVLWKSEPAVARSLARVPDDKAKALFRMWNDTYMDLLKKNKQATRVSFLPQWETLTRTTASTGIWNSVYAKFKELFPMGELAKRQSADPPLPEQERIAMQGALQEVCTYEKDSKKRTFGGVAIFGRPQDTDAERNHQATVAWLAAQYIATDNSNTQYIYMDKSINTVLKALDVTGVMPMSGEGSKPDLIRVRPDGKLDIIEIQSPSQSNAFMDGLVNNIETYFQQNCPDRLGSVRWNKVTKTEGDLYGVLLPK